MPIGAGGQGHDQIGGREQRPAPLRPLDEPETARQRPLGEAQVLELPGILEPVQIEMQQCLRPALIRLCQRIGRTADRACNAAGPQEASRQRGLARAELPGEIQDRQRLPGGGPRPGEPPAERLGVLGRLQ